MARLLQRGSSTARLAEDGWFHNETPVKQTADEVGGANHGKVSLLILLSGVLRRGLTSHLKLQQKESDIGFRSADMPDGNSSIRSLLNGSQSYKGFFTQLPDISTLSFYSSQSNSTNLGHPAPALNKKVLSSPLAKIIMLSFISIFVLVAVLGSTSTGYYSNPASRLIYSSYRKLQEDFSSLDLTGGGIFGLGTLHPKDFTICPKGMEHHVPCYNASTIGRVRTSDLDRDCELSDSRALCLVRPPKNYTLPFQWPQSKKNVWVWNTKVAHESNVFKTGRIRLSEENLLTFENQEDDGIEMHFQRIADILGIPDDRTFSKIGVQTALDIGCGYGAFVAHLLSRDVKTVCIASYETQNSHVQIALDRGLPAMIGSLVTKQLPFPASSFNMIHCDHCGVDWSQKEGLLLLEVDRLLKADGYFVWTMPAISHGDALADFASERILSSINEAAKSMCWASLPTKDQVFIWRKSADRMCATLSNRSWSICDEARNDDIILYGSLRHCLDATKDVSSFSEQQLTSPIPGFSSEEILDDPASWFLTVKSYWSIITPLLFSDHPKRPAEDDPLPPSNIVRNVMDMNALYGGFNSALLQAGKSVWVMNVVPTSGPNTLPIIYEHGLTGTLHDWCEAFPTYPRTYDLLHAIGLLSQVVRSGCSLPSLLLEMDRILRPEGWVLVRDSAALIEEARVVASQMRWESRTIEVEGNDDLRLLVCQKVFWKA